MKSQMQEKAVLENIVPQLEAEGFEVFVRPSANVLPPFMQAHAPDAIARRDDRNLAIEVLHKGAKSEQKLDELRKLLSGHREWELRVYWVSPANAPEATVPASIKEIERTIEETAKLAVESLRSPALLMAWAALEALGRALLPDKIERPQTPGRLVEVLASEGYVTPSEADHLRQLARLRNQLIHGGLGVKVASKDLKMFIAVLRTLQGLLSAK